MDAQECITRKDGQYIVTVGVTCLEKYREDVKSAMNKQWLKMDSYPGVTREKNETGRTMDAEIPVLCKVITAALFLIFFVLTLLFESPKYAVMIMLSVPFGVFGAFLLVFITGSTWNLVTLIGLLLLVGIVVNNGIRYTEAADRLSKTMEMEDALAEAGRMRMRPILITALAMILAVLPTVLLAGSAKSMVQGMAMVIVGGMVSATVLILLLFPVFYRFMYGKADEEAEEEELPEICE